MANDTYDIDERATGVATVTVTDDGTGKDWLRIKGTHPLMSDIRLAWTTESGVSTSASGFYWSRPGFSHRLVVNGLIENVRGGDGEDFIQGNELANRLIGDASKTGGARDVIWGGRGDDTILGQAGGDDLSGDGGDDTMFGGQGNDTISGGAGDDTIDGGAGADTMSGGGDAGDRLSYRTSDAGVTVSIAFGTTTTGAGGHAEGDSLSGFRNIDGSDFRDVLKDTVADAVAFGGNDNLFRGFGGRDLMVLGGGDDLAWGGDDHDTILGGSGDDSGWGDTGNDTLDMGAGDDIARGGTGRDVLRGGDGNDRLFGNAGDDILFPNDGDDFADGGAGNDQILCTGGADKAYGGAGNDTLIAAGGSSEFWGGRDVDRFEFRTQAANLASGGFTTIHDFARNQGEQIDLRVLGDFDFIGKRGFSGTGLEVRYEITAAGVDVFADVDGDGTADLKLSVDGVARMLAADFLLA